jgi:tyrosyl-tRNA synthetase
MNIYDELSSRGFVKQETGALREKLSGENGKVTFYIGFDPTADSLHVGHLMTIMAVTHMQRAGHVPIVLLGGGTAMIGDPSGRTEMRQMLSEETIAANVKSIRAQFERYVKFDGEGVGYFLNNADWLMKLGYIEFLREIGKYFRVNEMIKAEAYRARLEREEGLSFIEFNYQLLQAYDFLMLFDKYNCTLQMGGDDQWSNMLAGSDLIRRMRPGKDQAESHGNQACLLTFPLLVTATGQKMGKSMAGAVWLDPIRTSPYEFYQYWINIDDRDVERFLKLFTFLSLDEIAALCAEGGAALRNAKEVLAFEATRITHGDKEAEKARAAARSLFGGENGNGVSKNEGMANIPTTEISGKEAESMKVTDLLVHIGFASSKAEANRLVKAGGVSVDDKPVADPAAAIKSLSSGGDTFIIRKGKKAYHRVVIKK